MVWSLVCRDVFITIKKNRKNENNKHQHPEHI
jgi:hypothetical protein